MRINGLSELACVDDLFENRNTETILLSMKYSAFSAALVSGGCLKGRTKLPYKAFYLFYVKHKQFMEMAFNRLFNVQLFISKIIPEVGEIKH